MFENLPQHNGPAVCAGGMLRVWNRGLERNFSTKVRRMGRPTVETIAFILNGNYEYVAHA